MDLNWSDSQHVILHELDSNVLTALNLSENGITDSNMQLLGRSLGRNSSLEALNLDGNLITAAGAASLASALETNATLHILDLAHNPLAEEGMAAVARSLELNNRDNVEGKGLKTLILSACLDTYLANLEFLPWFQRTDGGAGVAALARALQRNRSLTEVYLLNNHINDEGADCIGMALDHNSSLTILGLQGNDITGGGAAGLARGLEGNTTISELFLNDNQIGDEGAAALAQALAKNASIAELHLCNNNITDIGASALAVALESNTTLAVLGLQDNHINDNGGSALARALESQGARSASAEGESDAASGKSNGHGRSDNTNGGGAKSSKAGQSSARGSFFGPNSPKMKLKKNTIAKRMRPTSSLATFRWSSTTTLRHGAGTSSIQDLSALATERSGDSIGGRSLSAADSTSGLDVSDSGVVLINLCRNQLGDKFALALARALESNTSLTAVDVSYNRIGDEGGAALATALDSAKRPTMSLILEGNHITDEAVEQQIGDNNLPFDAPLVGNRVVVSRCASRDDINGYQGFVTSYNSKEGRYNVQLDQGDQVALKPRSLSLEEDTDLNPEFATSSCGGVAHDSSGLGALLSSSATNGHAHAHSPAHAVNGGGEDYMGMLSGSSHGNGHGNGASSFPGGIPLGSSPPAGGDGDMRGFGSPGADSVLVSAARSEAAQVRRVLTDLQGRYKRQLEELRLASDSVARLTAEVDTLEQRAEASEEQVALLQHQVLAAEQKVVALEERTEKDWIVAPEEVEVDMAAEIGCGSFGVVRPGQFEGMEVAVKCVKCSNTKEREFAEGLLKNECKQLARVRHKNVLRLFGICTDPEPRLIMAYAHRGTLEQLLEPTIVRNASGDVLTSASAVNGAGKGEGGGINTGAGSGARTVPPPLSKGARYRLARGIAHGMAALHARSILHLDLKPQNVLIAADGTPWVSDFGLSLSVSSAAAAPSMAAQRGTLQYKAPELFELKPRTSPGVDVYAYGVLLYQLLSLKQPWEGLGEHVQTAIFRAIDKGLTPDYDGGAGGVGDASEAGGDGGGDDGDGDGGGGGAGNGAGNGGRRIAGPILNKMRGGSVHGRNVPNVGGRHSRRRSAAVDGGGDHRTPVKRGGIMGGWRSAWSPPLVHIVDGCWSRDPHDRPDFHTISTRLDELELLFPNDNSSSRSNGKRSSSSGSSGSYNDLGDANTALAQQLREAEARRREAEREVAELQRVADAEKAKCDAETSVLPSHWTRQAEDGGDRSDLKWWHEGRCVVDVDEESGEWKAVEALLNDSLPEAKLRGVKRIENRLLWRRYWTKRREVGLKSAGLNRRSNSGDAGWWGNAGLGVGLGFGGAEADAGDAGGLASDERANSQDSLVAGWCMGPGTPLDVRVNERQLWHGTGRTDPMVVVDHEVGLDHRFSSGGFFGHGLYLAEKARYSHGEPDFQYSHSNYNGTFSLLLVRATLGRCYDYKSTVNRATKDLKMPPRDDQTTLLYDSVQGGPHRPAEKGPGERDSVMCILYDLCQAYPEYIVEYEDPNRRAGPFSLW